eukprot:TRINITY_DN1548_c0_g1_i4.p1 TRINITY_DN1548_c0_g1~~TRINITY_DN1548_c0_g1_i4.p1  ORF type:complete len:1125 (+),score=299.53 TRINITY_DN1548_c0_g1_i4:255-3629(+)
MSQAAAPGKINVVCRFRPLNEIERAEGASSPYELEGNVVHDTKRLRDYKLFDSVLGPECSQQDAYEATASNCVDAVMNGYNAGMFAYGQSGGGKSYSLLGEEGTTMFSSTKKGVIPRALDELLLRAAEEQHMESKISLRFYELYGDGVYDLLIRNENAYGWDSHAMLGGVRPIEGGKTPENRHMDKLNKIEIQTAEEACGIILFGNRHRRFRSMPANPVSSRSHAIIQLEVERFGVNSDERYVSNLFFADLMGSEALSDGSLEETAKVNMDLSVLERVILALADGQEHLPYRECALTWVLKSVLAQNCCTTVLITCSPHEKQYHATNNTLDFGEQCKGVKLKVTQAAERLTAAQMEERLSTLRITVASLEHENAKLIRSLKTQQGKLGVTVAGKQEAEKRVLWIQEQNEALQAESESLQSQLREAMQVHQLAQSKNDRKVQVLDDSVRRMRADSKQLTATNLSLRTCLVESDPDHTREAKLGEVMQRLERATDTEACEDPSLSPTSPAGTLELEQRMAELINRLAYAEQQSEQLEILLHEEQAASTELRYKVENLTLGLTTKSTQLGMTRAAKAKLESEKAALTHALSLASTEAMHCQQLQQELEKANAAQDDLAGQLQESKLQLQRLETQAAEIQSVWGVLTMAQEHDWSSAPKPHPKPHPDSNDVDSSSAPKPHPNSDDVDSTSGVSDTCDALVTVCSELERVGQLSQATKLRAVADLARTRSAFAHHRAQPRQPLLERICSSQVFEIANLAPVLEMQVQPKQPHQQEPSNQHQLAMQELDDENQRLRWRTAGTVLLRLIKDQHMADRLTGATGQLEQQTSDIRVLQAKIDSLTLMPPPQHPAGAVATAVSTVGALVRRLGQGVGVHSRLVHGIPTPRALSPARARTRTISMGMSTDGSVGDQLFIGSSSFDNGTTVTSEDALRTESEDALRAQVAALQGQVEADRHWQRWHLVRESCVTVAQIASAVEHAGLEAEAVSLRSVALCGIDSEDWFQILGDNLSGLEKAVAPVEQAGMVGEAAALRECASSIKHVLSSSTPGSASISGLDTPKPNQVDADLKPAEPHHTPTANAPTTAGRPGAANHVRSHSPRTAHQPSTLLPNEEHAFKAEKDEGMCKGCVLM